VSACRVAALPIMQQAVCFCLYKARGKLMSSMCQLFVSYCALPTLERTLQLLAEISIVIASAAITFPSVAERFNR
jgi:hypothetical protein